MRKPIIINGQGPLLTFDGPLINPGGDVSPLINPGGDVSPLINPGGDVSPLINPGGDVPMR